MNRKLLNGHAQVHYDSTCPLCSGFVRFVRDRTKPNELDFVPLPVNPATNKPCLDSIQLVEQGRRYEKSDAVLRIVRHMRAPWSVASSLSVIPRPVRDGVYDLIARNRHRWINQS